MVIIKLLKYMYAGFQYQSSFGPCVMISKKKAEKLQTFIFFNCKDLHA